MLPTTPGEADTTTWRQWLGPALAVLALAALLAQVSGAQWVADPFGHFDQATRRTGHLGYLLTDTWTRPLPNLLYWLAAPLGLEGAFVLPASLVVALAVLVRRIARELLPHGVSPALATASVLVQHSVLEGSYVTMTEVPAAVVVAGALALIAARGRGARLSAYLVLGLLPLCRAEGLLFAAVLAACFAWLELVGGTAPRAAGLAARVALVAAPFLGWLLAGAAWTGDPAWYFRSSTYLGNAALRSGTAVWWLVANGFTMLPRLLPMALLPVFLAGIAVLVRLRGKGSGLLLPVFALLAAQLLVLTTVRTGQDPWADFHAAGLTRMYGTAAPAFALALLAGFDEWRRNPASRLAKGSLALALALMALGFPFQVFEGAGHREVASALFAHGGGADLATLLAELGAMLAHDPSWWRYVVRVAAVAALGLWLVRRRGSMDPGRSLPGGYLRLLAIPAAAAILVLWFPRGLGRLVIAREPAVRTHAALTAFGHHYREHHAAARPGVVQREVHSLAGFVGLAEDESGCPDIWWKWDSAFAPSLAAATPGTLALLGFAAPGSAAAADLRAPMTGRSGWRDGSFPIHVRGAALVCILYVRQ